MSTPSSQAAPPSCEKAPAVGGGSRGGLASLPPDRKSHQALFFSFFFLSGFASLIYELIWTRLAMAVFGITSAVLSIVLTIFMLGLALGAYAVSSWEKRLLEGSVSRVLRIYALCEAVIGLSAFIVPALLRAGGDMMLDSRSGWGSPLFTVASGIAITAAILPWTVCMGATVPLGMAVLRGLLSDRRRNFSFLYLANVLGGCLGTVLSSFVLIELNGFSGTLVIAASLNALVTVAALLWSFRLASSAPGSIERSSGESSSSGGMAVAETMSLFLVGLCGLGLEVVWMRLYKPFLFNYVYVFAAVLFFYLGSSYVGTVFCRTRSGRKAPTENLLAALAVVSALTLLFTDPRIASVKFLRLLGIIPPCFFMGWLTPLLVDRISQGLPREAGRAYAANVLGSILGPLAASFLFLPWLSERQTVAAFSLIFLLPVPFLLRNRPRSFGAGVSAALAVAAVIIIASLSRTPYDIFLSRYPEARLIRDHTATTVAYGEGMGQQLLVNGNTMTGKVSVTKVMTHLPLALRDTLPDTTLTICFGMGTSFRSALTWSPRADAVELVPGVYDLFGYFHDDAASLASGPGVELIVDDGRRFLHRTTRTYDLIIVDFAPPVGSPGTSLLLSREFAQAAYERLTPSGVLSHWIPMSADSEVRSAAMKAILEVFPSVRVFKSPQKFGYHVAASKRPLTRRTVAELTAVMPAAAQRDILEWYPDTTLEAVLQGIVSNEIEPAVLVAYSPDAPVLVDDFPVNEYFLLRWLRYGIITRNHPWLERLIPRK